MMNCISKRLSREIYKRFLSPLSYTNTVSQRTILSEIVLANFNRVDEDRLKLVGPDRSCAEWLLRNGALVRFKGSPDYLEDYNLLPPEDKRFYVEAVDATNSSISSIGFAHFRNCNYVNEVKLVNCKYCTNKSLSLLLFIRESLTNLEVGGNLWITPKGLLQIKHLKNLKELKLHDLSWLYNKESLLEELTKALPNCKIEMK